MYKYVNTYLLRSGLISPEFEFLELHLNPLPHQEGLSTYWISKIHLNFRCLSKLFPNCLSNSLKGTLYSSVEIENGHSPSAPSSNKNKGKPTYAGEAFGDCALELSWGVHDAAGSRGVRGVRGGAVWPDIDPHCAAQVRHSCPSLGAPAAGCYEIEPDIARQVKS